jgi:hypothetical protein
VSFAVLLVLVTASQSLGVSAWVLLFPAGALVALVCIFLGSRRRVHSLSELLESGLSAQLPVWAAREAGDALPVKLRDSAELWGRLRVVNTRLEWCPSTRSSR